MNQDFPPNPLARSLQQEYGEVFRMFREIVQRLNDEQWGQGYPSCMDVPARAAMHTLLCASFYIAPSPDGFDWNPAGVRFWEAATERLPTRAQTLESIARIEKETASYLEAGGDRGLLCEKGETDPVERPRVAWMIYALRHLQHHVAQMSGECKRRGLAPAVWG